MMRPIYIFFQYCTGYATAVALRIFTRLTIRGAEQLKSLSGPMLIVANHKSYWDPLIIGMLFLSYPIRYLPVGFMAADRLYKNIFFRIGFILTGTFPAYKGKGLDVSLRYPRTVLARGGIVVIFTYGGLTVDGTYPRPGRGAAMLVQDFPGVTIVPICVNTTPSMSARDFFFCKKEMHIQVGQPLSIPNAKDVDVDTITTLLLENIFATCKPR